MTIRTIAGLLIKLLGIRYAAWTVVTIVSALGLLVVPGQGAASMAPWTVWVNTAGSLGGIVVAVLFILCGDAIARALFPEQPVPIVNVSARDLLWIGLSLVGVAIAVSGVPPVAQAVGTALWYSGADRQAQFGNVMSSRWSFALDGALSLVAGVVLVWFARPLTALLSPKAAVPAGE